MGGHYHKKYKACEMNRYQGCRKQVRVGGGGAQTFRAFFHTKRAPSSQFIFGD